MAVDIELRRVTQAGTSPKRRQYLVVDRMLATSLESALAKSCARLPMLDRQEGRRVAAVTRNEIAGTARMRVPSARGHE